MAASSAEKIVDLWAKTCDIDNMKVESNLRDALIRIAREEIYDVLMKVSDYDIDVAGDYDEVTEKANTKHGRKLAALEYALEESGGAYVDVVLKDERGNPTSMYIIVKGEDETREIKKAVAQVVDSCVFHKINLTPK